jgi:tetratricopeptide (TPR) repeat protein
LLAGLRRRLGGHVRLSLEIAVLTTVVLAGGILIGVTKSPWGAGGRLEITGTVNPLSARAATDVPSAPILPIVIIQPFDVIGASPQQAAEFDALRGRLRDALARFDEIAVADNGALQPGRMVVRSTYRLAGLGEFKSNGSLSVSLWLTDADEGTIAWTRTFEVAAAEVGSASNRIVPQVATQLAQPYGVIYARELADADADRRYRCVMNAFEYRRGFRRATIGGVDACLEQVTTENPTFADGFALQALRALQRYYDWQGDSVTLLEHAVALAQKAVDLKPQSARARQALMSALFARREIKAALNEGEAAIALNPNDMVVLHSYGMHLLSAGQIEKGALLVRQAAAMSPVRPAMFEFTMFLSAYLLGDNEKAIDAARLFTNNDYPLLLVARAVVAARSGDAERARRAVERLMTVHPAWRDNARQRLERFFPSTELVDRLTGDLELAGLFATQ